MNYEVKNNDIWLSQPDFDLDETLDCGQAFRWEKITSEHECTYKGHFLDRPLTISQNKNTFIFHNTTETEFLSVWADYFDLHTDYGEIKKIHQLKDKIAPRAEERKIYATLLPAFARIADYQSEIGDLLQGISLE